MGELRAAPPIDRTYLLDTLARLAGVPTDVPLGETELAPNDPKITRYVRDALAPELARVGTPLTVLDDWNNGIGWTGPGDDVPVLLLMLYTTSQHGNFTSEEWEGRVAVGTPFGVPEPCVFGKGTNQGKGAAAAVLAALKALRDAGIRLDRRLVIAVNAEGRSSHACSARLIDEHGLRAEQGIICIGTGNEIVLGNRGRVDIRVVVHGRSAHSSHPDLGRNAIEGANEVLNRLRAVRPSKRHPYLGAEHLTVYKLVCTPIAPHTLPDRCELTLDRRILPGTDIDGAVAEIQRALAGVDPFRISVEKGAWMFPANVRPDAPIVEALARAHRRVTGRDVERVYAGYTFDAGYPCAKGIPTVMFGPALRGSTRGLGSDVTATEFVPVSVVMEAAEMYRDVILDLCGPGAS